MRRFSVALTLLFGCIAFADTPDGAARQRLYLRRVRFEPPNQARPLPLQPGAAIDSVRAQQLAANLERQLADEGYLDARVQTDLVPAAFRQGDLLLRVNAGRRYRIQEVRFSGVLGLEASELKQALRATRVRRALGPWKLRPAFSDAAVNSDLARLQSLYLARGYFDARVAVSLVEYAGERVTVTYAVQSGSRYIAEPPSKAVCQCLLEAQGRSRAEGRLEFQADLQVEKSPLERQVSISTRIGQGPPFSVGRIEFRGNHSVGDATLRRALVLEEGALFDSTRLLRGLARLNRMRLFEPAGAANVELVRHQDEHSADITIWLKELRPRRWSLSGPAGPPIVGGPLQGMLATRLPGWSTWYASISLSAFTRAPVAPLLALQRAYLPGQSWQSGFAISPRLGLKGTLTSYAAAHLGQAARAALGSDWPRLPDLIVPVAGPMISGSLICEPPRSRWLWLRAGGTFAIDWLLAGRLL